MTTAAAGGRGGGEGRRRGGEGRRRGGEGDCGGTCAQTLMCMFVTIFSVTVLEVVMTTVTVREPVAIETVAGRGMAIAALLPARVIGSATGAGSAGGSSRATWRWIASQFCVTAQHRTLYTGDIPHT